ncbi:hypothetical protein ACWT_4517 [Actinoplanes sp. SE50]|uniref:DUF6345 domain-containing protein n=1 Tax=unclassified Actinoplanes TaxID=2626549 RepID=UPI00023ED0B6|nr:MULTISPECIES: DUF6345 domain-containing protein [unclassified Actinoplanes]AEV85539.1 hypothetical protein ACPL_4648 [Actinoplanes sp. SE50/110]ATO83932.1 hypothetical protein ACWT_4517 [Actinoplanes sp. SE50]SLM01342.1 hypothetical protein ACSP50_4578 [Actinoplanes sp. SE50/110]
MSELIDARLVSGTDPNGGSGEATKGTQQDIYFFTSIEDFPPGVGDLSLTHDDAQGFYDYVKQFNTPNGWYRDASVGQWIYEETYDNYLDDYGFDAAKVVYHSGHGGMASNGVFSIPVGNDWGGDHWTSSNDMRLGNEYARYVFWSTCESVRVKGGQSPIRTWQTANLGLRMIFGYETVSVDNGDYGRFFFQEWNKNKSFSTAFLDASWRISHGQEPAVTACGATQAEATDRLFNERLFDAGRASTTWWWWRWYDRASLRARSLDVPAGVRSAKFAAASARDLAGAWTDRFGGEARLVLGANGAREVTLAGTAVSDARLTDEQAVAAARQAIERYRLAEHADLALDHIRYDRHAGASADEQVDEQVRERSVGFVQLIDGVPVVSPDGGRLHVRVDNEGTVTGIADSTRPVADLRDASAAPPRPVPRQRTGVDAVSNLDELFGESLQRRLRRAAAGGRVPSAVRVVPDSTEVGYAVHGDGAVLVARREVEVDFGGGLAKRYVLEEPVS